MPQALISKINGIDIVTVADENGEVFVPIKPICQAIGVDVESQIDKIESDEILGSTTVLSTVVAADGKAREMRSLPLKYVYGWLFTINPRNVSPEAREAVARYRRECYDVLYEHFTGMARRVEEANRAEIALLEQINADLEAERTAKAHRKDVEARLKQLRAERLNPQPTLF